VITFHIPGPLRSFADGRSAVELQSEGATLLDALQALWAACPGMRDRIVTEQGQVREHINIFLGNENIRYTGGLATRVPPGAEISIVPAISGGKTAETAEPSVYGSELDYFLVWRASLARTGEGACAHAISAAGEGGRAAWVASSGTRIWVCASPGLPSWT